jgi:hypothetical protein
VTHPTKKTIEMPKYPPVGFIHPGDIVFVGNRLMRIEVTRKLKDGWGHQSVRNGRALWEGRATRTGKILHFYKYSVRMKSPMSPIRPGVYPRAQAIGLHANCGGVVYLTPNRRIGARFCNKCNSDGRFGRPELTLDSEVNPIGRDNADSNSSN